MKAPLCPKCENHSFEANHIHLYGYGEGKNPDSLLTFIQCTQCGCVVGVVDTMATVGIVADGLRAASKE